MINENEKLEKFKSSVFSEAEKEAEAILAEAGEFCSEKLKEAEYEAENIKTEGFRKIDDEYRTAVVREKSSGGLEARRNVLLSREAVIDRVFGSVRAKLEEYVNTPEYEKLLINKVKECARAYPGKGGVVLVSHRDMKYADKLTNGGSFTVEESAGIELGGVMVTFPEDNLALDCTFDAEFKARRSGFAKKAGLAL